MNCHFQGQLVRHYLYSGQQVDRLKKKIIIFPQMCCFLGTRAESVGKQGGGNDCQRCDTSLPGCVSPVFVFLEQASSGMVPFLLNSLLLLSSLLQQRDAILRSGCPQVPTPTVQIAGVLGRTDTSWHPQTAPDLATRALCP